MDYLRLLGSIQRTLSFLATGPAGRVKPRDARRRRAHQSRLESLEQRQLFAIDTAAAWQTLDTKDDAVLPREAAAADDTGASDAPLAQPQIVSISTAPNTDAASLLAYGGPGNPSLPGFDNVGRSSSGNASVTYLGNGWVLTAAHVGIDSSGVRFGATIYPVDLSTIRQLRNSDDTLADLKVFKIIGDPGLPSLLPSMLAPAAPSGHVFIIGNGLTRGTPHFWHVTTTTNPWTWVEQPPPVHPGQTDAAGFDVVDQRAIRWGENSVDMTGVFVNLGSGVFVHGFTTQFDNLAYTGRPSLTYEAQATNGDSGGAVFSLVGGQWVLAGITLSVTQNINGQPDSTIVYGASTFMADLSVYRDQILSIVAPPSVVSRKIFYNQSSYDGNNAAANSQDNGAIATDKTAYLPGAGRATFDNITSYSRGINGIMVDIAGPSQSLSASDFIFRMGTTNTPGEWGLAPAPLSITVRPGAGVGGSNRVTLVWENSAIQNQWLQVIVKGNDATGNFNLNTGLAASDVFFFGNRVGDDGSGTPTLALTSFVDESAARTNIGVSSSITNLYDFDRSGLVNTADSLAARFNAGSLLKIDVASGPAAPQVAAPLTAGVDPQISLALTLAQDLANQSRAASLRVQSGWRVLERREPEISDSAREQFFGTLGAAHPASKPDGKHEPGDKRVKPSAYDGLDSAEAQSLGELLKHRGFTRGR